MALHLVDKHNDHIKLQLIVQEGQKKVKELRFPWDRIY